MNGMEDVLQNCKFNIHIPSGVFLLFYLQAMKITNPFNVRVRGCFFVLTDSVAREIFHHIITSLQKLQLYRELHTVHILQHLSEFNFTKLENIINTVPIIALIFPKKNSI